MDIRYLTRKEINDELWDKTVENSHNRLIYGFSWYLDAACNGSWNALIMCDYEYIMPLPVRKKFFISYVYNPFLVQQLGVFSRNEPSPELVADFFNAIPEKFKIVDIATSNNVENVLNFNKIVRQNQVLDLNQDYETLFSKWGRKTKQLINKVERSNLEIIDNIDFKTFYNFQKKWEPVKFTEKNREIIKGLLNSYDKNFEVCIFGVLYKTDLISVFLYIVDNQSVYLLLSSSNITGREMDVSYFQINHIIKKYIKDKKVLDFLGSSVKSISFRNSRFGAVTQNYTLLTQNNLPWWIKTVKKLFKI